MKILKISFSKDSERFQFGKNYLYQIMFGTNKWHIFDFNIKIVSTNPVRKIGTYVAETTGEERLGLINKRTFRSFRIVLYKNFKFGFWFNKKHENYFDSRCFFMEYKLF